MDTPSPLLLLVIVPIAVVAVPKVFDAVIEVIRRRRERDPASGPTRPRIVDPHEISDVSSLAGALRNVAEGQQKLFDMWRDCEAKHETCIERVGNLEGRVTELQSILTPELRRTLGVDP